MQILWQNYGKKLQEKSHSIVNKHGLAYCGLNIRFIILKPEGKVGSVGTMLYFELDYLIGLFQEKSQFVNT